MRKLLMGAALVLVGCAVLPPPPKPGEYSNYRACAYDRAKQLTWGDVPADIQVRARTCMVDAKLSYYTLDEMNKADAYARGGEGGVTSADMWEIDRDIQERMGGRDGAEAAMERACPETVRDLKAWRAANPV
jgi:hypothetical protein